MPRPDVFARSAPTRRAFRSGFWGDVPLARARPAPTRSSSRWRCGSRRGASRRAARRASSRRRRRPCADRRARRPGLIAICMATFEPDPRAAAQARWTSLRAQTDRDWVCVISDDCSSAASATRRLRGDVAGDPRFVVSRSERRLGFYRNFERALRAGARRGASCWRCATRTTAGAREARGAARGARRRRGWSTPTSAWSTRTGACCATRCGRGGATTTPTSRRCWSPTRSPARRRCSAARSPSWRCRSPTRRACSSTTTGSAWSRWPPATSPTSIARSTTTSSTAARCSARSRTAPAPRPRAAAARRPRRLLPRLPRARGPGAGAARPLRARAGAAPSAARCSASSPPSARRPPSPGSPLRPLRVARRPQRDAGQRGGARARDRLALARRDPRDGRARAGRRPCDARCPDLLSFEQRRLRRWRARV